MEKTILKIKIENGDVDAEIEGKPINIIADLSMLFLQDARLFGLFEIAVKTAREIKNDKLKN